MNALYNESLSWVGDGSEGSTLTQEGNTVEIGSKTSGTPFNARLDNEKCASDYFVQVSITRLKGSLSIGAVCKDEFKSGWKCKGLFYNGNLTNGSAALKTSWGPRFATGDSLGMRVSRGDALEVTFYKNGECLGTGFQLAGNTATYYPCLHVSGSALVDVEIPEQLPSTEIKAKTPTGFFGDWRFEKAWNGEQEVNVPEGRKLSLAKAKGGIQITCKIGNNVSGNAKVIEETNTSMTVETGPFMMTRMMPPPEFRPLENLVSSKKITTIELEEDTKLKLSGPELKVECSRWIRSPQALTSY